MASKKLGGCLGKPLGKVMDYQVERNARARPREAFVLKGMCTDSDTLANGPEWPQGCPPAGRPDVGLHSLLWAHSERKAANCSCAPKY